MKWYVQIHQKALGPMSTEQIIKYKQIKLIHWTTLCCQENSTDWNCFSNFPELCKAYEQAWFEMTVLPKEFTLANSQGKILGNFSPEKIHQQLMSGKISLSHLVWTLGFKEWIPIYKFKNLVESSSLGLDQEIIWTNQSIFD